MLYGTNGLRAVIVDEYACVATPGDQRVHCAFGILAVEVMFELLGEARYRGVVVGGFVEHAFDVGRQRHEAQQVFGKNALTRIWWTRREDTPCCGEIQ